MDIEKIAIVVLVVAIVLGGLTLAIYSNSERISSPSKIITHNANSGQVVLNIENNGVSTLNGK